MDQIRKIDAALLERQGIIEDQIAQLNVIREQKIDLDKQIQLMMNEIADLRQHIARYESDISRLQNDKEGLILRLNELTQLIQTKIDDIEEIEALIREKDRIIDMLHVKLTEKKNIIYPNKSK